LRHFHARVNGHPHDRYLFIFTSGIAVGTAHIRFSFFFMG
jgi:hypothetical protein